MERSHADRRTRYSLYAIRTALFELLGQEEPGGISVTRLCRLADVNRGTFYKYYRDVYDLCDQLETGFIRDLESLLADSGAGSAELFASVARLIAENRGLVLPGRSSDRAARLVCRAMQIVRPRLRAFIAVRRPLMSEAETMLLGEYVLGGCARIYEMWLKSELPMPDSRLPDALAAFVETSLK